MSNYYSEPGNGFEWYVAGFGSSQNIEGWTDVEDLTGIGGHIEELDWSELGDNISDADMVVLAYTDEDGETHYWTIHGPFPEGHDFEQDIEDFIERYVS